MAPGDVQHRLAAILSADAVGCSRLMAGDEAETTRTVTAAIEIHEAIEALNEGRDEARKMRFRIGVKLGDVVVDGERIYGDGVNVAARLETLAEPGGTCVSAPVYDQVNNRISVATEDSGSQEFKNVPHRVHVYRLRSAAAGGRCSWSRSGCNASRTRRRRPGRWTQSTT